MIWHKEPPARPEKVKAFALGIEKSDVVKQEQENQSNLLVCECWGKWCGQNKIQCVLKREPVIGPYKAKSSHRLWALDISLPSILKMVPVCKWSTLI